MARIADTLKQAWEPIKAAYAEGQIGNEATLQAWLFSALRQEFPGAQVFCEMTVLMPDGSRCHPDLLFVEDGRVLIALELKLARSGYPQFENDIRKLARLCAQDSLARIEAELPLRGVGAARARFSPQTLCAFACVAKGDAAISDEASVRAKCDGVLPENFLPLIIDL